MSGNASTAVATTLLRFVDDWHRLSARTAGGGRPPLGIKARLSPSAVRARRSRCSEASAGVSKSTIADHGRVQVTPRAVPQNHCVPFVCADRRQRSDAVGDPELSRRCSPTPSRNVQDRREPREFGARYFLTPGGAKAPLLKISEAFAYFDASSWSKNFPAVNRSSPDVQLS